MSGNQTQQNGHNTRMIQREHEIGNVTLPQVKKLRKQHPVYAVYCYIVGAILAVNILKCI